MTQDLRANPRADIDVTVDVVAKSGTKCSGRGRNLSIRGMYVETDTVFAFGEEVTVRAVLGVGDPFEIPCIVRWCRPGAVGLQFQSMGVRETHAITETMGALLRPPSIPPSGRRTSF